MRRGFRNPGQERAFAIAEVVDEPDRDVGRLRVVAHLPQLLDVLQRHDEAPARRGVVHRRDARGALPFAVGDREHLHQLEVRVQDRQRVRQVVRHRHVLAVAGHRGVARVEAGAHLGNEREVPQVVLRDPAVARGEVDEAPVGRELRPAVQRVAAREARERLEAVAVEDRDVMVAGLHDDEEVQRIGAELRPGRQRTGVRVLDPRRADLVHAPRRRRRRRCVDVVGELPDLRGREPVGEGGHLRGDPPLRDRLGRGRFPQPLEVRRQERRPHPAETVRAVAARAVLGVELRRVRRSRRRQRKHDCKRGERPHRRAASGGRCREYGVTLTRSRPAVAPISSSSR